MKRNYKVIKSLDLYQLVNECNEKNYKIISVIKDGGAGYGGGFIMVVELPE